MRGKGKKERRKEGGGEETERGGEGGRRRKRGRIGLLLLLLLLLVVLLLLLQIQPIDCNGGMGGSDCCLAGGCWCCCHLADTLGCCCSCRIAELSCAVSPGSFLLEEDQLPPVLCLLFLHTHTQCCRLSLPPLYTQILLLPSLFL